MGTTAGILVPIKAHDVRRGALRDAAYLNINLPGAADESTRLLARHSKASFANGVTADYVGSFQHLIYNLRAQSKFEDRKAPAFAVTAPDQLPKLRKFEVDKYMTEYGMDHSKQQERRKAAKRIRNKRIEDWRATEKNRL